MEIDESNRLGFNILTVDMDNIFFSDFHAFS